MSQNLPAARPQITAGGQVAALIPQSLDEAFRVSQAIAASGLAPRGIDKAEQIMVAIMAGAELGLAPFQSLQSFAVVNGRPTLWGDGLLAVVRGRGVRVREWREGEGDYMVAYCEAIRPDTGEEIERSFSVPEAKKAGLWGKTGPWQQYPQRMLQMRARALALRDGCADMLRGIQVREEVEDYGHARDVTPRTEPGLRSRLEARKAPATEGFNASQAQAQADHNPETGEIIDAEVEEHTAGEQQDADDGFPGDRETDQARPDESQTQQQPGPSLTQRVDDFKKRLADAPNSTKAKAIWAASANLRDDIDRADADTVPMTSGEMETFFNERFEALETAEQEAKG